MTAAQMQTGQASDPAGDGGMTAGSGAHGRGHDSTSPRGLQAPNLAGLDLASLAASSVVTLQPGNGNGPHDDAGPVSKFAPLHADKLKDLPPVAWLIKGVIPKIGLTLIYGPTGGGKSFVTLDYAFQIARTRPVVYVAAEGAAGYAPRVLAWQKHHNGQDLGQLYFVPQPVNLLDPNEVDAFLSAITQLSPELVIVDTLARSMIGGDENAARDMGLAVEAADRIKRAIGEKNAGGSVILVHHSTKAGNTERGSGALKAACDQVIRLDNDGDLLTLTCEKSKDAAAFDPRNLQLLLIETGRLTEDGDPETSRVVIDAGQVERAGYISPNGRKLLETLAMETFKDAGGRANVLIQVTGMKDATFYRVASRLVRDGYARQHEKGDPYFITAKGDLMLSQLSKNYHDSNDS